MPLARSLSLILCIQRHHRPGPHWNVRGIGIKMGIGMRSGMGMGIGIWMRMGSGMEIGMQIKLGIDSV